MENSAQNKSVSELVREMNTEKYFMSGSEFKFIREKWGISLRDVAKVAGVKSHSSVLNWQRRRYVTYKQAESLMRIVGKENFERMREIYKTRRNTGDRKYGE